MIKKSNNDKFQQNHEQHQIKDIYIYIYIYLSDILYTLTAADDEDAACGKLRRE